LLLTPAVEVTSISLSRTRWAYIVGLKLTSRTDVGIAALTFTSCPQVIFVGNTSTGLCT
ncbi:hypothetical protein ACLOJK_000584, partial [Asimina triloba]